MQGEHDRQPMAGELQPRPGERHSFLVVEESLRGGTIAEYRRGRARTRQGRGRLMARGARLRRRRRSGKPLSA